MIESETSSVSYSGNNSTATGYVIPFPFLDPSHVVVTATTSAGVASTLTYGSGYTVAGTLAGDGGIYTGGSLTTASAIPASSTVRIKRVTPVVQPTDYPETGPFPAASHEQALDRLTLIAQETRRDAAPADSNIELSGVGMVAQTVEGTFAARTITPGDMLSVTNGDGVAGNPTVSLNFAGGTAVTSLASTDLHPVKTAAGHRTITTANLAAAMQSGLYGSLSYRGADIVPASSNGCTVSQTMDSTTQIDVLASFVHTGAKTGFLRVMLPDDYSGGELKMKLLLDPGTESGGGNAVIRTRVLESAPGQWALDAPSATHTETLLSGLTQNTIAYSPAISLGTGFTPGAGLLVELNRDPAEVLDTYDGTLGIAGVLIQYPKRAVTAAW